MLASQSVDGNLNTSSKDSEIGSWGLGGWTGCGSPEFEKYTSTVSSWGATKFPSGQISEVSRATKAGTVV